MLLPNLTKINCNLYRKDLHNIFSYHYLCYLNLERTNLNSMVSFLNVILML